VFRPPLVDSSISTPGKTLENFTHRAEMSNGAH